MLEMNFKLTIAIPTYNRAQLLALNLENIFDIIDENVQVIVSDNCSSDDTSFVCKDYIKQNNFLYTKNYKNIGYDLNILNCVRLSMGEYIWFLADDDSFTIELYQKVMSALEDSTLVGLLVDAKVVDFQNDSIIHMSLSPSITDKCVFVDETVFIENFKWSTLISAQVISRKNINIDTINMAVGTAFIQLPLFWNACFGQKIKLIVSEKLIKRDAQTNNFGSSTASIWLWNLLIVSNYIEGNGITKYSLSKALSTIYSPSLSSNSGIIAHYFISRSNGEGQSGLDGYRLIADRIKLTLLEKIIIILLSLIPDDLMGSLRKMLKKMRK